MLTEDPILARVTELNLECEVPTKSKRSNKVPIWAYPLYLGGIALPTQGFKLHVSASTQNAVQIFDIVIPYLLRHSIPFKVIKSLDLLYKLNLNKFGYTQVGKFITIYSQPGKNITEIADNLDNMLKGFEAPKVPSDIRLNMDSIIYYRYGVINTSSKKQYIISNTGQKILDKRHPEQAVPSWINNPFSQYHRANEPTQGLLLNRFIIFEVLRQRAKGGVFLALELHSTRENDNKQPKTRRVILKEARRLGEIDQQGNDAIHRLKWQYQLMQEIQPLNITPKIYDFIQTEETAFLITEVFGSNSLRKMLLSKEPDHIHHLLMLLIKAAEQIKMLHNMDIFFFDLSPDNILVDDDMVALIDFEYSQKHSENLNPDWTIGTSGFAPKSQVIKDIGNNIKEKLIKRDIYALGQLLLAIFKRKWYIGINRGYYANTPDWGQSKFINDLDEEIKYIIAKSTFKSNNPYEDVIDFISDTQKLLENISNHESSVIC